MKIVAIPVLFYLSLTLVTHPLRAESAEEMVSNCKAISEASVSNNVVDLPTDFGSGVCWGSFTSVQELIVWAQNGRPIFGVCAPATSTRTQLIQIFLVYAKEHPEKLNKGFLDVALQALGHAFPCSK